MLRLRSRRVPTHTQNPFSLRLGYHPSAPRRIRNHPAFPQSLHQEQGVQSPVVKALSNVPPCGEDQELLAIGYGDQRRQRLSAFLRADTPLQHNQVAVCPQAAGEKIEMVRFAR